MVKKLWLLLLSLVAILFVWITFANPIVLGREPREMDRKVAVKIEKSPLLDLKISEFPFFWAMAVLIETLVLFLIAKIFWKDDDISNGKLILFWILPTTITLPLLWFLLPLIMWEWLWYIIIWELLVTIIEAIIIKYWLKISRWKAIMASIICNIFSFIVWIMVFNFFYN